MKNTQKLLLCLMLQFILVSFTLLAETQRPTTEPTDDLYDYQFEYPVNPGNLESGIACDGNYIYTASPIYAADFLFHKYNLDGTYVEDLSISGLSAAVTDLTYDGQYFYYGSFSGVIYQIDMSSQSVVDSIVTPNPYPISSLAYDEFFDGFWINNGGPTISCVDRNGNEMESFTCNDYGGFTGFAWENILPGGPHLWAYSSDLSGHTLVMFNAFAGVVEEVYDINASGLSFTPDEYPSGLFITDSIVTDTWSICGLTENTKIWGLELSANISPDAPAQPTDVVVTPDASGNVEALIEWVCPTMSIGGEPLGFLNEMRVYRDDMLIYTDTNPQVGQPGSYTDNGLPPFPDYYTYKVTAVNNFGEGFAVEVMQFIGEDVPAEVIDLVASQTAPNELSVTLNWINPTTGFNGGVFNEPIIGYQLVRSDGVTFDMAGLTETYVDSSIPETGNYSYTVQAYNSMGMGGITTSNIVFVSNQDILIYEDFSSYDFPPSGWSVIGDGQDNWALSTTNNSNGNVPEGMFFFIPDFTGLSTLTSPVLDTSGMNELSFEFKYFLFHAFEGYSIGVSTTSDGGATWNNVWEFFPNTITGPEVVNLTINTADVGSDTFQLGLFFNGNSMLIDIWLFDDIILMGQQQQLGSITGNIALIGGNGNVEDVLIVSSSGETAQPDANGDYFIETTPGVYSLTASLNDYETVTIDDVEVVAGQVTSGIDFDLIFNVVLDPPSNVQIDDQTGLLTWEVPGGVGNTEELIYDNGVATDGYSYLGFTMSTRMSPAESCQLLTLKYYTTIQAGANEFAAKVYEWNGNQPGTTALYNQNVTAFEDEWVEVDVSNENLFFDSDFVVGFGSINGTTFLGFDQDLNNGRSWDYDSSTGFWAPWSEAYLERAVVQYPDGRIVELAGPRNEVNKISAANLKMHGKELKNSIPVTNIEQTTRELLGYEILLDSNFIGMTSELFWQYENLVNGESYEAGIRAIYDNGESDLITVEFTYGGTSAGNNLLAKTDLKGNYPNPFNPDTTIKFTLAENSLVDLSVYNIKGEKVKTLLADDLTAADYSIRWDGRDDSSKKVSTGVYFYQLQTRSTCLRKKMILLK